MANKFLNWAEETQNVLPTYEQFESISNDRYKGFRAGEPARSKYVNAGLRQANLVAKALMDIYLPNNSTLDFLSSSDSLKTALEPLITKGIKKIGPTVFIGSEPNRWRGIKLTEGKSYLITISGLGDGKRFFGEELINFTFYKDTDSTAYFRRYITLTHDYATGVDMLSDVPVIYSTSTMSGPSQESFPNTTVGGVTYLCCPEYVTKQGVTYAIGISGLEY